MFGHLKKILTGQDDSNEAKKRAVEIYSRIVAQARQSLFYREQNVPDTIPGRFEMIALHMYLVLDRFDAQANAAGISQELVDVMFADMDDVAREIGVGDMGVAPRIKKLARSFRSRLEYYRRARQSEAETALEDALLETIYDNNEPDRAHARWFAGYVERGRAHLAGTAIEEMTGDANLFPPPEPRERY